MNLWWIVGYWFDQVKYKILTSFTYNYKSIKTFTLITKRDLNIKSKNDTKYNFHTKKSNLNIKYTIILLPVAFKIYCI